MSYTYEVAASVLHDSGTIEKIFSAYAPALERSGGKRTAGQAKDGAPGIPDAFFILTGGTEHQVLTRLRGAGESSLAAHGRLPTLLVAHPRHNSLPAALEILARLQQDGRSGRIILLESPADEDAIRLLTDLGDAFDVARRMRETRIGAVGEPSDWLAASSQSAQAVMESWGASIVPVPMAALFGSLESPSEASDSVGQLERAAHACAEPSAQDIKRSGQILDSLRKIVRENRLDALTLRCFDLVLKDGSTGCLALSLLADQGIDAGCEGDIPSILALRWARLMTGSPAWMANPAWMKTEGENARLLLAHCTVPSSLVGDITLRSHFESGLGAAISGRFEARLVTLLRLGGKNLEKAWIAEGKIIGSPSDEGLCRTQAEIELRAEDAEILATHPLGNHLVMASGHWARRGRDFLEGLGIEVLGYGSR